MRKSKHPNAIAVRSTGFGAECDHRTRYEPPFRHQFLVALSRAARRWRRAAAGFATAEARVLVEEVARIAQTAAFRHLVYPWRLQYVSRDDQPRPPRPGFQSHGRSLRLHGSRHRSNPGLRCPRFFDIAVRAAAEAGFVNYHPDTCLINRYIAGAKLSLHQDRDEKDAWSPVVSVSLGLPAVFLWGANAAPIRCAACVWKMATSQCGALPHASFITASPRSKTGSIH